MSAIFPIALNTFREARRNRVFYATLFFAVALIGASILFTEVTFVAHDRILRDVGFATMNVFCLALAIFLGIGMVNREIEKRTIYTVVSKPVPRWAFILGKYLGLVATMVTTAGLMLVGFLLVLWAYGSPITPLLFVPWLAMILELMVVIAFAVFCSTWTSSVLSGLFAIGFVVIGHTVRDIRLFGSQSNNPQVRSLAGVVYRAMPDLERFNLKSHIAHLDPVSLADVGFLAGYGALWAAAFLFAAILVFQQRDFR